MSDVLPSRRPAAQSGRRAGRLLKDGKKLKDGDLGQSLDVFF